jgi:hypothetical protein
LGTPRGGRRIVPMRSPSPVVGRCRVERCGGSYQRIFRRLTRTWSWSCLSRWLAASRTATRCCAS